MLCLILNNVVFHIKVSIFLSNFNILYQPLLEMQITFMNTSIINVIESQFDKITDFACKMKLLDNKEAKYL